MAPPEINQPVNATTPAPNHEGGSPPSTFPAEIYSYIALATFVILAAGLTALSIRVYRQLHPKESRRKKGDEFYDQFSLNDCPRESDAVSKDGVSSNVKSGPGVHGVQNRQHPAVYLRPPGRAVSGQPKSSSNSRHTGRLSDGLRLNLNTLGLISLSSGLNDNTIPKSAAPPTSKRPKMTKGNVPFNRSSSAPGLGLSGAGLLATLHENRLILLEDMPERRTPRVVSEDEWLKLTSQQGKSVPHNSSHPACRKCARKRREKRKHTVSDTDSGDSGRQSGSVNEQKSTGSEEYHTYGSSLSETTGSSDTVLESSHSRSELEDQPSPPTFKNRPMKF